MSDKAQRVLDALMAYNAGEGIGYPFQVVSDFLDMHNCGLEEDYEALTVDEEKQVLQAFLKLAYEKNKGLNKMEINGHEQLKKTTEVTSEAEYKAKLLSTLADKATEAAKLGEPIGTRIAAAYLSAADLVKNEF